MYRNLSLCLALSLGTSSAFAEVKPLFETPEDMEPTWVDNILEHFGADGEFDDSKSIDMSYLPTAYYTPEKKFGVGVLMVGVYDLEDQIDSQPSSLVVNSYISMNRSYGVTIENMNYVNGGKNRLSFDVELHNEAAVYYGQGVDAGNTEQNKHEFEEIVYSFKPMWMTELSDNYFLGFGGDVTYAKAENLERVEGDESFPSLYELPSNLSSGVLLSSIYDSRDYRLNATKGWLFQVDAGFYYNDHSESSFSKYGVEVANYIALENMPGLIAWQVKGEFTGGDTPWNMLPDLGGSSALRGLYQGQYRDANMAMAQVEYRLPIFQRYGMVFWGGAGNVADEISNLNDDLLTSVGTGFRFRVKDRINLRVDIGYAEGDTNFYLNVNEVF
ncbi:BamA/TamA family outer membrane protein [Vibrio sp. SCSIO 43135]|uniref:BamA/TamA family outer membrane protein n=1 Tax=Vibrio sp. SCSIO 43135 TaxID=2819096 RepID=UPI00207664FB|nr:BamA/TamA family outer membrane protein [Vibrio sp. SCSIO 43135]USD41345.1 BamA/TamA family outer membrane protein [Vibrio sp. SCSIO 43135]